MTLCNVCHGTKCPACAWTGQHQPDLTVPGNPDGSFDPETLRTGASVFTRVVRIYYDEARKTGFDAEQSLHVAQYLFMWSLRQKPS